MSANKSSHRSEAEEPLHISPFCPPESKDAIFGQDVKAERVDPFLIDDYEGFLLLLRIYGLVAHQILEINDFFDLEVYKSPFRLD